MPLPCRLGWHRVDPLAQWNSGYYFATCARCGRDLVRTAFDGWRIPSGYRVVWQAEPPAHRRAGLVMRPGPVREPEYASERPFEFPFTPAPTAEPRPCDDERSTVVPVSVYEVEPGVDAFSDYGSSANADDLYGLPIKEAVRSGAEPDTTFDPRRTAAESLIPDWWDKPVRVATPFDAEIAAKGFIESHLDIAESTGSEPAACEPETIAPLAAEPGEDELPSPKSKASDPIDAPLANAGRPEPRYPVIPDFMDDGAAATAWDGSPAPASVNTLANPSVPERARRNWHTMRASLQRRVQPLRVPARRAADMMSAYHARRAGRTSSDGTGSSAMTGSSARQVAVTFVALLAGVALVGAVLDSRDGGSSASLASLQASVPRTVPHVPRSTGPLSTSSTSIAAITGEPTPDQGFVTASLLNCRATPAGDGNTVRKLARGAPVRILGTELGWLSISHRGRQCWASSRFISTARPL